MAGGLQAIYDSIRNSVLMKSLENVRDFSTWHGTPWKFMEEADAPLGRFRNDKMGSGEGAQAFTWGHYTTGYKPLAQQYRDNLAKRYGTDGGPYTDQPSQTRGELAQVIPDMAYVPPLRWSAGWQGYNRDKISSPGMWLGRRDAPQILDNMMSNKTWAQKELDKAGAASGVPGFLDHDAYLHQEMQDIANGNQDWLSPEVLSAARNRVNTVRTKFNARDLRNTVLGMPDELRTPILDSLGFASYDPKDITPSLWNKAILTNGGPRDSVVHPDADPTTALQQLLYYVPEVRDPIYKGLGLPSTLDKRGMPYGLISDRFGVQSKSGAPFITDLRLLGRNGQRELATMMQSPEQLRQLREQFGIDPEIMSEAPEALKSLYQVQHNVSPADLWFLDAPLGGQKEDFVEKFINAGKNMVADFSPYKALTNTGYNTYKYLKGVDSPDLQSMPFTANRNQEITDRLLGEDITGAMFRRGGYRNGFENSLSQPFNPDDYNFVTYDPSTTEITGRFKSGGPV